MNFKYLILQIITNREFAKAFGRAMWRPAFLPLPEFAVNLIFSSERARVNISIINKLYTVFLFYQIPSYDNDKTLRFITMFFSFRS